MKRTIALLITLFIGSAVITAQVTDHEKKLRKMSADTTVGWKYGGVVSLSFTQTSLTNWAAGGKNSFAANGLVSLYANYKKKNITWDNSADLGYGLLKQTGDEIYRKTDDKIDFLSKFGYKAFNDFYGAALFNFKTQMTPGYNYPNTDNKISDLLAPAYVFVGIGADYKPNEIINVFFAPITSKTTIVNNQTLADAGAFGVEGATYDETTGAKLTDGKKARNEFGGYMRVILKADIMENVSLTSKLDLFSNYANNPEKIDVNWESLLALKVNKFISATLNTHLIYDYDIEIEMDNDNDGIVDEKKPAVQFKEILGVGLTFKF